MPATAPLSLHFLVHRRVRTLIWAGIVAAGLPAAVQAQKAGGTLNATLREPWPSLSIHEEATPAVTWPVMPMYSNLVLFDPMRAAESADHLIGELAESWAWSDAGKKLTFKLRRGVVWHDGQPFTSADVVATFDLVRGIGPKRLKLNPRKLWYENVRDLAANGDFEVSFLLKRPQPGLLSLLASGNTPIYPAHVDPAELRTRAVGTGPFMAKSIRPDEELTMVRNPHYFVKGRPYLDGIRFTVIRARQARIAALIAGQLDIAHPAEGTAAVRDQVTKAAPQITVAAVAETPHDNILFNTKKPPFDNPKVRQAVNFALDRDALNKSVFQGTLLASAANLPPPYGPWGLPESEVRRLPGWGDPAQNKAEARKLLAEAGYGPEHPLKVVVSTRAIDIFMDVAVWAVDQMKQIGVEATLEQFETGVWFGKLARREFQIATNLTGLSANDPDANYYENYACGSQRNYTDYCSKEVEALIEKQSAESSFPKRLELVHEIDRRLYADAARPILGYRLDFFLYWPYVKGFVKHNSLYNDGRMQEVWLDR